MFREWLPHVDQDQNMLDFAQGSPERVQALEEHKTVMNLDFVYCMGGDGTLLRLLRILFMHCVPPVLPKIVTFSMGSMSYLCYFDAVEYAQVIDHTFLASKEVVAEHLKIDYRTRLSCKLENIEPRNTIG